MGSGREQLGEGARTALHFACRGGGEQGVDDGEQVDAALEQ